MILAVASCYNYRDTWRPFFALLEKFWPDCPYRLWLLTDRFESFGFPYVNSFSAKGDWCSILHEFAERSSEEILLMQDDFFITAPVKHSLIEHGLKQMAAKHAACVRLYPCPGADEDCGDKYYGLINLNQPYLVSCQAAIWDASYLAKITQNCGSTAADFEIMGSNVARTLQRVSLAFKRDMTPWPLEYICSGISRGLWNPDTKRLCDSHGIEVDWSMRSFQKD